MKIETLRIADLTLDPNNARQHDEKNLKAIQGSLTQFGQRKPIVITEAGTIVAGNGTVEAAKRLGWTDIEVVRVPSDWTEAQVKAFAIADNRTAELANWNQEVLTSQLLELEAEGWELAEFGFEAFELPDEDKPIVDDEVPEYAPSRVALGDVWQLGKHKIACADSTDLKKVEQLMGNKKAQLVLTDPPFGNDLGYGRGQLGERRILNDENTDVLNRFFPSVDYALENNSHCLVWIQWRTFSELKAAFYKYKLRTVVVWDKKQAGLSGGGFAEQYEMLCVFIKGKATQNEYSGNVWSISREHGPRSEMQHPHKKPIEVLAKAIKLCSKSNDLVLDIFGGSGSTLIACAQTNRTCYMMELDPKYCDVIIERWEKLTGQKAELLPAKAD
jgi:site-specific DNA-methyltransferase (adenine-specific)